MDRKELEAQVLELVATAFKKDVETLSMETTFKGDLAGASVQMVALVAEIENELDACIMLSDAGACETIADLVDLVEEEL